MDPITCNIVQSCSGGFGVLMYTDNTPFLVYCSAFLFSFSFFVHFFNVCADKVDDDPLKVVKERQKEIKKSDESQNIADKQTTESGF